MIITIATTVAPNVTISSHREHLSKKTNGELLMGVLALDHYFSATLYEKTKNSLFSNEVIALTT